MAISIWYLYVLTICALFETNMVLLVHACAPTTTPAQLTASTSTTTASTATATSTATTNRAGPETGATATTGATTTTPTATTTTVSTDPCTITVPGNDARQIFGTTMAGSSCNTAANTCTFAPGQTGIVITSSANTCIDNTVRITYDGTASCIFYEVDGAADIDNEHSIKGNNMDTPLSCSNGMLSGAAGLDSAAGGGTIQLNHITHLMCDNRDLPGEMGDPC